MSENKGNLFVHRPIVAMVIAIVIVIVGAVSLIGLPMEQYPNMTPPIVEVRTTYTRGKRSECGRVCCTPIEQEMNGVDNMIYMKSTNANDGTMVLQVSFDVGTDPDMNTVLAQNRVSAAIAKLPAEVTKYGVTTKKSLPNFLTLVALTTTNNAHANQEFLGNYALINIKDVLARIPGIGRVDVLGASNYSMRIWIKPDRLSQLGITVPEILGAINEQNVIVPGGKFGAEPAPAGTEFTYTVRLPDRFNSPEAFEEIVIRTQDDGSQVKIGDVAKVNLGVETYNMIPRLGRNDGVGDKEPVECAIIATYPAPGANAVELAENIDIAMKELVTTFS